MQITNKVRETILNHMFGSVEAFERMKSDRLFYEYSSALSFCRNHNVNDDNVETFVKMFVRPVVEYSADTYRTICDVVIPFANHDNIKSVKGSDSIRGARCHREHTLEEYLYMGMYSVIHKYTEPYRDQILRGDLSAAEAVRKEVFEMWKEEVYQKNGMIKELVDLVEAMTTPKIVPSLWRPVR